MGFDELGDDGASFFDGQLAASMTEAKPNVKDKAEAVGTRG